MRLARAGVADEAGIELLIDPFVSCQFQHLLFAQARHGGEVIRLQILQHREAIVAGQRREVWIQSTIPSPPDRLCQRFGIVAPELDRHCAEQGPGADQPVQNRAAGLIGQCDSPAVFRQSRGAGP